MKKGIIFGLTVMLLVSVVSVAIGDGFEYDVSSDELMGDVIEIRTWEDPHNMRDALAGSYRSMNNLTTECEDYDDYASDQANDGRTRSPWAVFS
ncbi:MAG: hypothetical protein R6U17_04275 [Thermoplasmata archaeon]